MVENLGDITACPARPLQPVVGPADPSNPNGPQQLFPYGKQQERDYDNAYQQALDSIVGGGSIPWPSLDDTERAKDESLAQVRANAQVNAPSARAR